MKDFRGELDEIYSEYKKYFLDQQRDFQQRAACGYRYLDELPRWNAINRMAKRHELQREIDKLREQLASDEADRPDLADALREFDGYAAEITAKIESMEEELPECVT